MQTVSKGNAGSVRGRVLWIEFVMTALAMSLLELL